MSQATSRRVHDTFSKIPGPFISGEQLYEATRLGERMTIIDSHWGKTENSAWEAYVGQHLPGAMFCNPLQHLAGTPSRARGRNPMPGLAALQRSFYNWGITEGRPVVIYDAGRNIYAARAWWILRWAGVENVKILNGGTSQWEKAGGDVAGGIGALRGRGDFKVRPRSMPELYIDEIDVWCHDRMLVDCRDPERFRGVREPFDHQAGHIPSAVNIPVASLLDEEGKVLGGAQLREIFASHSIDEKTELTVHSGSGLDSALFLAAMDEAGLPVGRHFVGGWSQWSASSSRKIARG